jgi:exopolysaccharide biosynthesis polyprenyl glycosylphosphotransferase
LFPQTADAHSEAGAGQAFPSHPIQLRPDAEPVVPLFSWSRRQVRVGFYLLMLITDVLSINAGFAVGSFIRHGDFAHTVWFSISVAATPIFVLAAMHTGAYSLGSLGSAARGIRAAVGALVTSFAILFVISYFLKAEQDVSRLAIGAGATLAFLFLAISRKLLGHWIRLIFKAELTATVIIADESFVADEAGTMVIDPLAYGIRAEPRNPMMVQRFSRLLCGADRVIVACPREACSRWADMLKGANVCGEILADEVQSVGAVGVDRFADRTTLVVSSGPLSMQQSFFKRLFDLVLAVPITIFFAPLLIVVAIAIKIDSPGPVLFRQPRVGQGNRLFDVYKFRSMVSTMSDTLGSQSTLRDDARITRVGRFIRRTSIDELPQLFNVLGGSMSLVGPRPHAIGSCAGPELFWDIDNRYGHRHLLKPGITGLAQIRGYRGTVHQADDLSRRLQADLEYINGWSIWRDIVILFKTFNVVVHPNAY